MKKQTQEWLHQLMGKFPNVDKQSLHSIELTGDEIFLIYNLVKTEWMLSNNKDWPNGRKN